MTTKRLGLIQILFILSFAFVCLTGAVSQPVSPSSRLINKIRNRYKPDPRQVIACRDKLNASFNWAFDHYSGELHQLRILFQRDANRNYEVIPLNPKDFNIEGYTELKDLVLKYRKKLQHIKGVWFIIDTPRGGREVSIKFNDDLHKCLSYVYNAPQVNTVRYRF